MAVGPPLPSESERTNEAIYGERYANGDMEAPIYRSLVATDDSDVAPRFASLSDPVDDDAPVFASLSSPPQYHVSGYRRGLSA